MPLVELISDSRLDDSSLEVSKAITKCFLLADNGTPYGYQENTAAMLAAMVASGAITAAQRTAWLAVIRRILERARAAKNLQP